MIAFWGARYAIVEDPGGNPVGLMSPIDAELRHSPAAPPRPGRDGADSPPDQPDPHEQFLPWHVGPADWPGAAFCSFRRD